MAALALPGSSVHTATRSSKPRADTAGDATSRGGSETGRAATRATGACALSTSSSDPWTGRRHCGQVSSVIMAAATV